jgi:hypothetical protein
MKPKIAFQSAEQACKAVQKKTAKITARAFDRFHQHCSEWWLIPGTDWPAHRRGKVYFSCGDDPSEMFIAFHVEKGVGQSGKDQEVMKADWMWNQFLNDFEKGWVPERIERLARETKRNPEIVIQRNGDYFSGEWKADRKKYKLLGEEGTTGKPHLSDYSKVKTHRELCELLRKDSRKDRLWIDFFIGFTFKIAKPSSETQKLQDAKMIQEKLVRFFHPWIA